VTAGEKPLLLPLTCKTCGQELSGGAEAFIYVCLGCGEATHMSVPDYAYRLLYVRPSPAFKGTAIFAPFWRIVGRATLTVEADKKRSAYQHVRPLGPLFFAAFWNPKAVYYDNLTLRFAQCPEKIEFDKRSDPVLAGIRDPKVLPEMARLTWLAYLDRFSDVTGVDLQFQPERLDYCAVPFFKQGSFYSDGVLGIQLPPGFFAGSGLKS